MYCGNFSISLEAYNEYALSEQTYRENDYFSAENIEHPG